MPVLRAFGKKPTSGRLPPKTRAGRATACIIPVGLDALTA